jgi:hypothetical protein
MIIPMPTAIVGCYTPEGFVIAADGRSLKSDDDSVISDQVQKVFPLSCVNGAFAFALSGNAVLGTDDNTEEVVNLISALNRSAKRIKFRQFRSPADYVAALCSPVNLAVREAREARKITSYPGVGGIKCSPYEYGTTIANVLVMGYHEAHPCQIHARFFHEDQVLKDPQIHVDQSGEPYFFGSREILEMLNSDDPTFAPYRVPMLERDGQISPIDYAVEVGRKYIEACSTPEALSIDEPTCRAIGGHIHIAKVTRENGFHWIIPPIEQTTTTAPRA